MYLVIIFFEMKKAPEVWWLKWEMFGICNIKHWMYNRKFFVRQEPETSRRNSRTSSAITVAASELEARTTSTRDSHWILISIDVMQLPSIRITLSFTSNCEHHTHSTRSSFLLLVCCHIFIDRIQYSSKKFTRQSHTFPHHIFDFYSRCDSRVFEWVYK